MVSRKTDRFVLAWLGILVTGAGLLAAMIVLLRKRREAARARKAGAVHPIAPLVDDIQGLTQEEVDARKALGQNIDLRPTPRRSRQQIIRGSILTIFNLNLVALAVVQLLLGRFLDALITLGVMALNIGANLFQVEFAQRRLRSVQEHMRVQVTVIRDGRVQGVDPDEIVVGDALAVATGDQIVADGAVIGEGSIIVDESAVSGNSTPLRKRAGDTVYAGSACLRGRAAYRAEKIGDERQMAKNLQVLATSQEQMTPIEKVLNRIMRILLVVVFTLGIFLVSFYFVRDPDIDTELFADYISVIFGIAPASLFFMVVLTYVAGTADLAAKGALVRSSRSVESLAQVDVICFAKAGILTGGEIEMISTPELAESRPLSDARIRQILGDYAATTSTRNFVTRAMAETFPGSKRIIGDEAPFLSVYGWSALVFDDDEVRGTYVLAEPELLQARESAGTGDEAGEETEQESTKARVLALPHRFGRLFRRGEPSSDQEEVAAPPLSPTPPPLPQPVAATNVAEEPVAEEEEVSTGLFGRLRSRIDKMLDVVEVQPDLPAADSDLSDDDTRLVFAFSPAVTSVHTGAREPRLPENLIPLCYLSYLEQIRPEAIEAIQDFADRGVAVKLFSPDPPEQTIDLFRKAGVEEEKLERMHTVTGAELVGMDAAHLAEAANEHAMFGQCTIQQMEQIVQALRAEGRSVALIGDRVSDMAAMRQADLAIAPHSAYPAVFQSADIVLLDDSPTVLSRVVDRGQRIVNGLLDILKLNLNQALYMLLLILLVLLIDRGFPIKGAQAGLVAFITVVLPALGLTLWADAGVQPARNLGWLLIRFVVPAGVLMAVAGFIVFTLFLQRDGAVAYAQIGLIHALVAMGLLLVIFIKPPLRYRAWATFVPGDLRPTILALVGAILFVAITYIPLASGLLKVTPLRELSHYLVIAQATIAWAITVQFVWLLIPLGRHVMVRGRPISPQPHFVDQAGAAGEQADDAT